ncbi:MAG: DUF2007 domain-containing protein [Pseudomonadales bacterium]|uniref:RanBP2-type domain-containing protein n=1 Tax=Oleiphilus messinensis TaxID=141451 RepID=A0A1Y0IID6_9GAMM|nr:DUF2007 domain-containing protein [Oleiphilus messinensis]ARU59193.1 hypothetical protein OLMES_5209 [Oleiphilus messinensis]MCG8610639.1 DUF2007 domain-containing protein [Pseudomonadales bacterium]
MKLVYTHENRLIVSHIRNQLAEAGIETVLKNEYLGAGAGDLAPIDTWLEVWIVHDRDDARAREILTPTAGRPSHDWICPQCNEINDPSFEICWHCQHERQDLG